MDYVKISRKILEWEWYTDINTKVLFLHILLKANWKLGRFQGTDVPRGSFVTSQQNLALETAVLRMADDQYRKIIYNAQVYANTGAGTYEKAVDMATKDFLKAGLNCLQYANGARHTIADYADMAIRTASKRAYLQGEGVKRQEWGIHTVIINKRGSGCPCPLCVPFVGKVMIDDVWSGGTKKEAQETGYRLMSDAITAGLYHPRCRDSHTTYFPGISTPPDGKFTRKELKEIETENKQEARQQYAERQAEKFGRLAGFSLDSENRQKYEQKQKEWKHVRMRTGDMSIQEYTEEKKKQMFFTPPKEITNKWTDSAGKSGTVDDLQNIIIDTQEYRVDGRYVVLDYSEHEKNVAEIIAKMYGGKTWNTGVLVDGTMIAKILNTIGINADWINTGAIEIKTEDGETIFRVDMDSKSVYMSGDVRIGGKKFSESIDNAITDSKNYADSKLADYSKTVADSLEGLQGQIDGQIESFYYEYEPSLQNIPASEWTTTEERKKHEGDLFFWKPNKDTGEGGYAYRFLYDSSVSKWEWVLVQDTDITKALAAAQNAQDTADGKRRTFVVTPYPPYDIGDTWNQEDGDILTCVVARAAGTSYVSTDWKKLNKYTDDTTAEEAKKAAEQAKEAAALAKNMVLTLSSEVNALELVNRMQVRQFDWKIGGHQNIGFVADELEKIDPNLTLGGGYDENGEMNVKQINSPYLLNYAIKAIQELSVVVENQNKHIEELKRRLS